MRGVADTVCVVGVARIAVHGQLIIDYESNFVKYHAIPGGGKPGGAW